MGIVNSKDTIRRNAANAGEKKEEMLRFRLL